MKLIKITASFSCKKQVIQFEPIEVFMGIEAEISADEDVQSAQAELFAVAKLGVETEVFRLTGKKVLPTKDSQKKKDFDF